MLTKPAHSFSALSGALIAASAGSSGNLVDADFILDRRVVGGLQLVPIHLAADLRAAVRLSTPVSRIEWDDAGVVVAAGSETFAARRALVAVLPTLVSRIGF